MSASRYEVVYVLSDGSTRTIWRVGAPDPTKLYRGRPLRDHQNAADSVKLDPVFVTRYFPSRKSWALYDLRHFIEVGNGPHRGGFVRAPAPMVFIPDKDAAIMYATLRLSG